MVIVIRTGVPVLGLVRARTPAGSSPSRLIAKSTRTAPISSVITTVVRPATAPAAISVAKPSLPTAVNAVASAASGSISLVGHHPGDHQRDRHVEHGADRQRAEDALGQVLLRVARLLGGRRDHVEADVGEEHHRGRRDDAEDAERLRLDPERPTGSAAGVSPLASIGSAAGGMNGS